MSHGLSVSVIIDTERKVRIMDAGTFGSFIARCRRKKNMTQGILADKLNVTDKAVSRWERGIGFPDISTVLPLSEALNISVQELMSCEDTINR